jgi:hypothetical protein
VSARERYGENLEQMRTATAEKGAIFVAATQQVKTGIFPSHRIKGVTYEAEASAISDDIREYGDSPGRNMLYHWTLMQDLRQWARESGTPLVDAIHALDQDRDTLSSWVHLLPRGNQIIARAFADEIGPIVCEEADGVPIHSAKPTAGDGPTDGGPRSESEAGPHGERGIPDSHSSPIAIMLPMNSCNYARKISEGDQKSGADSAFIRRAIRKAISSDCA